MDSHDAKIASSVLAVDGPGKQAAPPRRRATQLKARMYGADGTRLRGMRASVAELILDQQRSAHTAEEAQFFAKEVWQAEAGESGLTSSGPLAASAQTPASSSSGRSHFARGLALRPDMFGHVGFTAAQSTGRSVEEMVMQWGTTKRGRSGSAEEQGQQAGLSAIPATHRWRRVVSRASHAEGNNRNSGGGGFGWERADAIWREATLRASAAAALERGEGDAVWRAELRRAAGLSGDEEEEGDVATRPASSAEANSTAFFTVTEEEYTAVLPSLAAPDAEKAAAAAAAPPQRTVMSYAATCKLIDLYERYGNMVVVADRWPYWGDDGSAPLPRQRGCSAGRHGEHDEGAAPPIEQLCEWYSRLTEAVLRLRLRRLQQELGGRDAATPSSRVPNAQTSPQANVAGESVELHPLLALLRRHPFLHTRRGNGSRGGAATNASATEEAEAEEGEGEQKEEQSSPERSRRTSRETSVQSPTVGAGQASAWVGELMRPAMWYDAALEGRRRARLRAVLLRERTTNVPLQRAVAQYDALCARATPLLQRALAVFYADDEESALDEASPDEPTEDRHATLDESGDFLAPASPSLPPPPPRALFRLDDLPLPRPPGSPRPGAKPQPGKTRGEVKADGAAADEEDTEKTRQAAQKGKRGSRAAEAEGSDTTYRAVQREVREVVPVMCARLARVAQAGWMLPAPVPVHRPLLLSDDEEEDGGGVEEKANERSQERESKTEQASESAPARNRSRRSTTRSTQPPPSSPPTATTSGVPDASSAYDYAAVQKVNQTAVCNRAFSQIGEAVLLSLPRQAPRLYREVEEELEKYLWEDPYALMEDDAASQELVGQIRVVYAQNLLLQRYLHHNEVLCELLRKVIQDTDEATRTAGQ